MAECPEFGQAVQSVAKEALSASLKYSKGGDLSINISTTDVQVVRDVVGTVCTTVVTLGALYAGYHLMKPLIEGAVKRAFGGERDDQEFRDIKPGSLNVLLHCLTDERFLEVLEDYESGELKKRLQEEFLLAGIKIEGIKVEILNMEEVCKSKEAINERRMKENPTPAKPNWEKTPDQELAENQDAQNGSVANYKRPIKPYKVVFTGAYNVGKTSLFRRIFKEGFCDKKPPSSGDKRTHEEILHKHETIIPLEFWDTVDLERHASITQSYYRGSKFVLLVYSADDEYSLHKLSTIVDDVKLYEPAAKLILVRNKIDLPLDQDGVPEEKEKVFLRNIKKKILANFWTSAKTNEGVEDLLKELGKHSVKMFKSRRNHDDQENGFRLDLDDKKQKSEGGYNCCG
ncbi:GTP-binding YPT6 [Paramuricea clavata]|uniref:GTP-binding YPT6 n=2 Tax=Paramuricea clavata TaxID=317549 RepID=A0A6S7FHE8_PARCT|nr:GTP-binding YPT6 [Paramuricea clavata]